MYIQRGVVMAWYDLQIGSRQGTVAAQQASLQLQRYSLKQYTVASTVLLRVHLIETTRIMHRLSTVLRSDLSAEKARHYGNHC